MRGPWPTRGCCNTEKYHYPNWARKYVVKIVKLIILNGDILTRKRKVLFPRSNVVKNRSAYSSLPYANIHVIVSTVFHNFVVSTQIKRVLISDTGSSRFRGRFSEAKRENHTNAGSFIKGSVMPCKFYSKGH
jgi:hypothetical protein